MKKFRPKSMRLPWWDYAWNHAYFVTICTKDRVDYFGEVKNGIMCLNELGSIAYQNWLLLPIQFPFVKLGDHIIMPDHMHGALIIDYPGGDPGTVREVQTGKGGFTENANPMLHNSLSRAIRWYKGRTTYDCRKIDPNFKWQSLFHDIIIQNKVSYENISQYILNNPKNWGKKGKR